MRNDQRFVGVGVQWTLPLVLVANLLLGRALRVSGNGHLGAEDLPYTPWALATLGLSGLALVLAVVAAIGRSPRWCVYCLFLMAALQGSCALSLSP